MADFLGISQAQYHRCESGKVVLSENQWQLISEYLDIPLTELLHDEKSGIISKKNIQRNSYFSYNMYLSDKIITILEERIKNLENEILKLKNKP